MIDKPRTIHFFLWALARTSTVFRGRALLIALLCINSASYGDATSESFKVGAANFRLNYAGEFSAEEKKSLLQWLQGVVSASNTVYGRPPLGDTYLELIPYRNSKGPVPFGQVIREDSQGIRFYVNPTFPLQAFIDDWTAYHEFSHLLMPFPGPSDIWFAEGLASYYQNIVRARAGLLGPLEAWQKIYAGFERGAKDTRMKHLTLKQLSPKMWDSRSFMRVYWSGAYYFFSVDIALRELEPPQSLDQVLSNFQQCCLSKQRQWSAVQLVDKLDQLSGTQIFSHHYQKTIASTALEDFSADFSSLGLELSNGKLKPATHASDLYLKIMTVRSMQ